MLPSPWDDRARFDAASSYADTVYRNLLPLIAAYLNRAHGVQHPLAYWRVVVGPWLLQFVHVVYDRYSHITDAVSRIGNFRTATLAEQCFRTPSTTRESVAWLSEDDHYNWQILSELLTLTGSPAQRSVRSVLSRESEPAWTPLLRRRPIFQRLNRLWHRGLRASGAGRHAWLTHTTASRAALLGIAARSAFRVIPFSVQDDLHHCRERPVWDERRVNLGSLTPSDEFERVCIAMLPRHCPTVYVEGYAHASQVIRRRYPVFPRLLVSETGWYSNETFKYLAAEAVCRGTKLVAVQHGGGYGLARRAPLESFEQSIAHAYFVWGWADGSGSLRNVPHPIVSARPKWKGRRTSRILFAPQSTQRYLHRLESSPAGTQWQTQYDWQARFLGALPDDVRRCIVLREPPVDFGHHIRRQLRGQHPEIGLDDSTSFKVSVSRSRITVVEKLGTAILETLAMNAPTVAFWDPTLWSVRDEAASYLDMLREAGILWDSPCSAAAHVAAVYEDTSAWWDRASVQDARRTFAERFALAHRDWAGHWLRALEDPAISSTGTLNESR